jgi:kynurenine formamidase
LSRETPAYANGEGLSVETARSIACGHSSNSVILKLSNHLGTHVDTPRHFFDEGKTVDAYQTSDWIFSNVFVADIPVEEGGVVDVSRLVPALVNVNDADLLFFRTGFESRRGEDSYWAASPGFDPGLCDYLLSRLPSLSAIGMDTISIASLKHRDMGRAAHRAFLGAGIRIFEDVALAHLPNKVLLSLVIALPLLYKEADGAPCSLIGTF